MKACFPFLMILLLLSCSQPNWDTAIQSPDGSNAVEFQLTEDGIPTYFVTRKAEMVIDTSTMGFDFKDQNPFKEGFELLKTTTSSNNEVWEMPWGEQREVINHYNALSIELQEKGALQRRLNIHFRAYDDGIAFRYEFLEQEGIEELTIMDEHTEFQLTGDLFQ